ncbi:hypothetical protein IFM12276_31380 [Nocardia sputorum]|uniref:Uncharacterized protein n=2 Tax=Nocardiaceae TaxID=85025 RepID=A0ABM8CYL5_9NOCA|nr:hypothetical protein IFM12276_31380 [Nocardia sputorum]
MLVEEDRTAIIPVTDATDVRGNVTFPVLGIDMRKVHEGFGLEIVEVLNSVVFDFGSMHRWRDAVADYVEASFDSMHQGMLAQSGDQDAEVMAGLSINWAARVSESLTELASYLVFLEQMLNDFIGADLRKVELAGVPLEGLRWSEQTTQWPDRWRE